MDLSQQATFIWSIAEVAHFVFKPAEYGKVILPFTVLRRLECVLEPTKKAVWKEAERLKKSGVENPVPFLRRVSGFDFYNASRFDLPTIAGDPDHVVENMKYYLDGFSPELRTMFERFDFEAVLKTCADKEILYEIVKRFSTVDLHPGVIPNTGMGDIFEHLIHKFSEALNDGAGEYFTPRDVIELMVHLIFTEDEEVLTPGNAVVRTIYDPTCGTGGMLSTAEEYLRAYNPSASVNLYGQEIYDISAAICTADMLIKGQNASHIICGNTLTDDGLPDEKFDYCLANPPYGVDWKKDEKKVRKEHQEKGYEGRFGPGLPRTSDGSTLFLLHMISKLRRREDGGGRLAVVLNGSPLFTGNAGSGESEIRRYCFENDLVEAIIALPTDMFFNTGISTYIWILSNRKDEERRGKVQLIDASSMFTPMRKSKGSKRKEISPEQAVTITQIYGNREEVWREETTSSGKIRRIPVCRIFRNRDFGYTTITVERPLRDAMGNIELGVKGKNKGKPIADSSLRDTENVPLNEDIEEFFKREVLPYHSDAWIDYDKSKIGYEISFNRYFYVPEEQMSISDLDKKITELSSSIMERLAKLSGGDRK